MKKIKQFILKKIITTVIGYEIINMIIDKIPDAKVNFDGYDDYEDIAEEIYRIIVYES